MEDLTQNKPKNTTQIIAIIGLIIVLVIGALAVFQRTRLQNQAAVPIGGGACQEPTATCALDLSSLTTEQKKEILGNASLIARPKGGSGGHSKDVIGDLTSFSFPAINGVVYECVLQKKGGGAFAGICPSPAEGGQSCQGPTPTIITPTLTPTSTPEPTPIACPDCGNPGFKCTETKSVPGSSPSCPVKALWKVEYKAPSDTAACKQKFTELDCDKHTVVVHPTNGGVDEILTKDECLSIKAGTYTHRVDKGLKGEGCQEYKIVVIDKTSTPPGADITNEVAICQNCIFKASCPDSSCSENKVLSYSELIDIPELKPDFGECTTQESQTSPCYMSVGNKCSQHGTSSTFRVCALGRDARIWVDDPYNGGRWIKVNFPPGENCTDIEYKYENSGLYDVVLECRNPGTSDQNFHCQERITRHCADTSVTPTVPVTPSPTPGSCPILDVELILECPGGNCPTPTR